MSFIIDILLLNFGHLIVSFVFLYYFNREYNIFSNLKETHRIDLKKRMSLVFIFYTVFYFLSTYSGISWLKYLENVTFYTLSIEHNMQQSKGLLLKKIKQRYDDKKYISIKKIIDLLTYTMVVFLVFKMTSQEFSFFNDFFESSPLYLYFALAVFSYMFIFCLSDKSSFIKLFSLRFIVVILSIFFVKIRGSFHGIEYLTIVRKFNINFFSKLPDYKKILAVQILSLLGMCFITLVAYLYFFSGHWIGIALFPLIKSATVVHFLLDHYLFTQRYSTARKITANL